MLRRFITIFLLTAFVAAPASAQSKTKYSTKNKRAIALYEEGRNHYMNERLQMALEKFEEAKAIDAEFVEAYFMCSEIYKDLGEYAKEFNNIQTAVGLDSTMFITGYFNAGVALCNIGEFIEATKWFELYKKFAAGRSRVQRNVDAWLERAMAAKAIMEKPVPYNPRPVSENLTSNYDMYWPSLTLDEQEIVFTMLVPRDSLAFAMNKYLPRNSANFNEDFYMSRQSGGQWQSMTPILEINTRSNEGAQALSADGQWMFFTACGRKDSKGSCDLYFSRRTPAGWTDPINVGAPVNTPYWESQPCFSADGQTLYFVSNRPGGKGGNDIWSATITGFLDNGVPIFETPVNLGDSINTAGDETSPFIHPDNKTLYFSSDGWTGVGRLDIFISRRDDNDVWGKPRNIGYPINTPQDDNGLVINASGTTAYFASTIIKPDGTAKRELRCFDLPETIRPKAVSYVKGFILDARTNRPIGGADLELIRLDNGKVQVRTTSDSKTGTFIVSLPSGHDYALIAGCDGYLFESQGFALKDSSGTTTPVKLDIRLSPLVKGEKVTLNNVFFDTNSTELKPESFVELDKLVSVMTRNPELKIEIGGHTDNVGSAEYNKRLSEGRAETTVKYLLSKGIAASRISHKGYGLTQPVADNSTDEGRAANRRIEAKIVE